MSVIGCMHHQEALVCCKLRLVRLHSAEQHNTMEQCFRLCGSGGIYNPAKGNVPGATQSSTKAL
jgi:hypothetical protein